MTLPIISGREAVRTFEKDGWVVMRQRGSHVIMVKEGIAANLAIPDHRELDRGLLRSLIRKADLSVAEFLKLLDA